jgi:hypothetical protein
MRNTDEQTPIRERWTAQPPGRDDEAAAGALLRAAAQHGPVGEKRLAEIHARVRRSQRPRAFARPAPRLLRQLVFAAGIVLSAGALSASVMHVMRKAAKPPEVSPVPALDTGKKPMRRPSGNRVRPVEPVAPSETFEAPAPTSPQPTPQPPSVPALRMSPPPAAQASAGPIHLSVSNRRLAARETPGPVQVTAPVERPVPSPAETRPTLSPPELSPPPAATGMPVLPSRGQTVAPVERPVAISLPAQATPTVGQPGPSRLARESRLLAGAISKLRQEGQPEQALAILDRHRSELASGALAPEANATRIEALLRLGRNGQALALLDGRRLSAQGLGREMLIARAELRADKGRTSAAFADFDLVLSTSIQTDAIAERALYGRATCRAKSGDWNGARGDFQKYINTFPQGRFARDARSALAAQIR